MHDDGEPLPGYVGLADDHVLDVGVQQVAPALDDLAGRRRGRCQAAGRRGRVIPDRGMGGRAPQLPLCVEVAPTGVGQEILADRVSLIASTPSGTQTLGQAGAIWIDDAALLLQISRDVARYTGHAELAQAIQRG